VLAWQASEVAELLEISVAAVNSSLQRARASVHQLDPETESEPLDEGRATALLADYVAAFEHYDIPRIVQLLAEDAVWEMPPYLGWYRGNEAIGEVIRRNCPAEKAGDQILVPTHANGQPAFGLYMRQPDDSYAAFQLQVLTLDGDRVSHVSVFFDLRLFEKFGLPATVEPT
jgi:RNA polymerase sigma-70 factor (ECF subfamily)